MQVIALNSAEYTAWEWLWQCVRALAPRHPEVAAQVLSHACYGMLVMYGVGSLSMLPDHKGEAWGESLEHTARSWGGALEHACS